LPQSRAVQPIGQAPIVPQALLSGPLRDRECPVDLSLPTATQNVRRMLRSLAPITHDLSITKLLVHGTHGALQQLPRTDRGALLLNHIDRSYWSIL